MNTAEATQELNRRIDILSNKPVPVKNKAMLRGGMNTINQRRDVTRYRKEIGTQKQNYTKKLASLNNIGIFSLDNPEPEIELEEFNEPRLRRWF